MSNKNLINNRTEENLSFSSLSKEFVANYHRIFTELVDEALARIPYLDSIEIKNRIKKMAGYYALAEKPILAELFLYAYEMLEEHKNYNEVKKRQAYALACVMEMGTSYFLIIDDMEDDSKIRRGKLCWHLLPDTGPLSWNDASAGQHHDISTSEKQNYKNFTMDQYKKIAELKTALPAIKAPIILALILANKDTNEAKQQVHDVCNDIGVLIQIKNDLMDMYRSNDSDLKSSTDIQKGRCSWLAVKALEMCNIEQQRIFQENYGNCDESCVQKIQELYNTLQLQQIYEVERQRRHENFLRKINELPPNAIPSADIYKKLVSLIEKFKLA
ncbi:Farnesyl diphosphate synthase 2 [Papilio machaon]|uniref:Farnesyl pyrophosphate synthase n=1 Tax=Papilio machaon TaxID=76193 RepID=A0A0N0PE70_PAPMA|nr:Farnesyl diphosphate synthase 2 [Papilio machaon]